MMGQAEAMVRRIRYPVIIALWNVCITNVEQIGADCIYCDKGGGTGRESKGNAKGDARTTQEERCKDGAHQEGGQPE